MGVSTLPSGWNTTRITAPDPRTVRGPTAALNEHLEYQRGSALGIWNLAQYMAGSLCERGRFTPRADPVSHRTSELADLTDDTIEVDGESLQRVRLSDELGTDHPSA